MLKEVFNGFHLVHGVLLALAAIGFFTFWVRIRFWLPQYVHVLGGISLAVGLWVISTVPADTPVSKQGPVARPLFALLMPALVYFFFVFYGGQRAAFRRTASQLVPCPFCRNPLPAQSLADGKASLTRFVEPQCRHCGQTLTQLMP